MNSTLAGPKAVPAGLPGRVGPREGVHLGLAPGDEVGGRVARWPTSRSPSTSQPARPGDPVAFEHAPARPGFAEVPGICHGTACCSV